MLKKSEIRKIAIKLGWEIEEVNLAVKELRESPTIIDYKEFLRVCVNTHTAEDRWLKIRGFLLEVFKGRRLDDLIKTICHMLQIDPCFYVLALFNAYDLQRLGGKNSIEVFFDPFCGKSFFYWGLKNYARLKEESEELIIDLTLMQEITPLERGCHFCNPASLTYAFLDTLLLVMMASSNKPPISWPSLINEIVAGAGFLAFNIKQVRVIVSLACYASLLTSNRESLDKLVATLNDVFLNRKKFTERRYWLFYALAAKLIETKSVTNPTRAFKKAAQVLNVSPGAIRREYYKKTKIVSREGLTLDDVIREFGLGININKLLISIQKEKNAI